MQEDNRHSGVRLGKRPHCSFALSAERPRHLGQFERCAVHRYRRDGGTATLNISSTQLGATTALPNTTTIAGVGVARPAQRPLPDLDPYTLSFGAGTAANLASTPMTAGAFAPASPIVTNSVNGFISGNLLTVTSVTLGATFTGQLSNQVTAKIDNGSGSAGNILTVTAPTAVQFVSIPIGPQLAPGMTISNVAGTITGSPTIVSQLTSASTPALGQPGLAGTYLISGSPQLVASGTVQGTVSSGPPPGPPQDLNVSGVTGTLLATMIVTDSGAHIGPLSPLQTRNFAALRDRTS